MTLVECELIRVVMSESQDVHILWLKEKGGKRRIPIYVGMFEVFAIHRTLNQEHLPRPLTHELFGSVLDALGATIEKVVINDLREKTFFGRLHLRQNGRAYEIDSRPSDAIALAVQKRAPIYVAEPVLAKASRDV